MMIDPTQSPMIVSAAPTRVQLESAIRTAITAAGSVAAALGYAGLAGKLNAALALAGPAAVILGMLWGQLAAAAAHRKLVIAASAAPNSVAQVK
jgi:hypothetical protein